MRKCEWDFTGTGAKHLQHIKNAQHRATRREQLSCVRRGIRAACAASPTFPELPFESFSTLFANPMSRRRAIFAAAFGATRFHRRTQVVATARTFARPQGLHFAIEQREGFLDISIVHYPDAGAGVRPERQCSGRSREHIPLHNGGNIVVREKVGHQLSLGEAFRFEHLTH